MTDTMALWKGSHWLSNTPRLFAQRVFKEEWEAAVAHRGSKLWIHNVMEAGERLKENGMQPGLELLVSGLQEADELARPKRELLERATEEVRKRLRTGQYRAFGFDRPRTLDTQPVQLPAEVWTSNKSLEKSEVTFQSLTFIDVRVRMVSVERDPLLKAQYEVPAVKAGRPTVGPAIEAAFDALHKIGEIDPTASQKHHFPKIRTWIERNEIDVNIPPEGISDKTISKFFSPLFKRLKEKDDL
ncbi:hypothetical protein [Shimia sp. R9_3]|uniref:hypothetical protein n=1 Tax=Shimia sp. R9_3 TaxID=2821113 RepID=UPI001ADB9EC0|nr:hypothetical protein [Shimia sp. R9_3]MBO9403433.1 hypothetical protein [Shimia sp. R9_3]